MKKIAEYLKECNQRVKLLIAGIVVGIVIILVAAALLFQKEPELAIVSESSLKEIINTDELATLEYFYHSIVQVKDEETDKVKYHVTYEGTVRMGINFEEIKINIDEANKQINVLLPDAELFDYNIEPGTLDFIFEKEKYETETVIIEAESVCKEDLRKKASGDTDLMKLAKESAMDAMNALLCPWIEQVADEYTVVVK